MSKASGRNEEQNSSSSWLDYEHGGAMFVSDEVLLVLIYWCSYVFAATYLQ